MNKNCEESILKSCVQWRKSFAFSSEVNQFNIDFRDKRQKLLYFLDQYATKQQRVNIRVPDNISENQIELFAALKQKNYNIAVCFTNYPNKSQQPFYDILSNNNVPFYFSYVIDNWDELLGFSTYKISDMYISGELGFDLIRVSKILHQKNIKVRCYANICQERWVNLTNGYKSFFIRPEDIDIYNEYIDILQFFKSENIQNTLYEVYFKDKKWDGNLQQIIKGLKIKVNSYYILSEKYAKKRINCGRKCLKGEKCTMCDSLLQLSYAIENSKSYEVFEKRDRS